MKISEAMAIIDQKERGYMVSFHKRAGGVLHGDHFPDKHAGEPLIPTEEGAWNLARHFADATDSSYVNIYVIGHGFRPVKGYESKKIRPYPVNKSAIYHTPTNQ